MDAFIAFIKSDAGLALGWCCTVLGLVLGGTATYRVNKMKVSIRQVQNNIPAPVTQKGQKNSNITTVTGDANITM